MPARRQQLEQTIVGVTGVLNDFPGLADAPTGIDVLYAGELTAADLSSAVPCILLVRFRL